MRKPLLIILSLLITTQVALGQLPVPVDSVINSLKQTSISVWLHSLWLTEMELYTRSPLIWTKE